MDTQRLILFLVFAFSVVMLANEWRNDQHPASPPVASTAPPEKGPGTPSAVPTPTQPLTQVAPVTAAQPQGGQTIHVQTDLVSAEIDTAGGGVRRLELLAHRDTRDKTKNFVLLQNEGGRTYVAQSGLIGNGLPDHRTLYTAKDLDVKLAPEAQSVNVRLQAPASGGVSVTKIYTFHRGSYGIDVTYEIENKSDAAIQPDAYFQFIRDSPPPPAGDSAMLPTFTGMAVYTDKEKFHKIAFSDLDKAKFDRKSDDGWIAALQHYFLSAWLPADPGPRELYAQRLDNGLYAAGVIVSVGPIPAGQSGARSVTLYAGPQEQDKLSELAPGLDRTVDYGKLTVIATPLFAVLQWIHRWCGNWGVAIIILTILIKALFFPLSAASYRSMARMRALAPRMQRLKEQYGDDRQRMNLAMMELYKTEKVNPLGGCLPVVVQIPVFISLYWVLLASVELRHAPFVLWIHDLSAPDPYFVLPVLMGATMIFQTFLNPEPPDPIQAKVMKIMPVAFSVFFFFFPAGLVLYWLVNNILSIAQQWQITRAVERPKAAHGK